MLAFIREWQSINSLRPLLSLAPGAIGLVIALGIVTALFEGLGISLFIPLFQSLSDGVDASKSTFIERFWNVLFSTFSPNQIQILAPLLVLILLALKNGFLYLNTITFSRFNWRISHRLRTQIFSHLLRVDTQFLMDQDAGKLMSILDKEAWQTTQAMSTLATLIISLCTLAVFAIFLLLTSWRMTVLSLLLLLLVSAGIQTLTRRVKQVGQQATLANMEFVGQGFEQLSGLETIRQFGQQRFEQRQFEQASSQMCASFIELDRLMGAISPLSEMAFTLLLTCVLLVVLRSETTDLPAFLTFLFMLYRLLPQVKILDSARANLIALTASVNIVTDLMETTFRQQVPNGSLSFDTLKQGIQFRDVTFQYRHGDRPAIQQLSFHIPSGKTTAFVGPSGSGKSTILGLILRRFDPTQGIIEVDGKLLTSYDLNSWHQRIATVSQNIYLFNRSVRENIAYGWPEATDADIITSAQMADAHDFIMAMPQGYNTVLGDRGVRLSGGQRQRLALARCLLRNPQILILDEATNALDSLSETFIQETLVRLWHDRTVIIVAHRLSTIEQADQILVIDAGQVVEQGTLPELLNQAGLFAQMYRLQTTSDQNPLAEGH